MRTLQPGPSVFDFPFGLLRTTWWGHILWVLGAAVLGWAVAAFFAGALRLSRPLYLVPYVVLSSGFIAGYVGWSGLGWQKHLRRN